MIKLKKYIFINICIPLFLIKITLAQQPKVIESGFEPGIFLNEKIYSVIFPFDFRMVCLDTTGGVIWERSYGGNKNDWAKDIFHVQENGTDYLLWTGSTMSFESGPFFPTIKGYVIKTNLMGDTLWTRVYDRAGTLDFCYANDSNYIFSILNSYGTIIKVDRFTGDTLWTRKNYWQVGNEVGLNLNVGSIYNSGDGFYVAGTTFPSTVPKIKLMKTDTLGQAQWVKAYGDTTANSGFNLTHCQNGDFIIIGGTAPAIDTLSYHDFNVLRVNASGDTVWTRRYAYNNWTEFADEVIETDDKGILILGHTKDVTSSNPVEKGLMIKTDSVGHVQWAKLFRSGTPHSLSKTPFGYFSSGGNIHFFDTLGNDCTTQDVQVLETYSQITIDSILPFIGSGLEYYMSPTTEEYASSSVLTDYCLFLNNQSPANNETEIKIYPNPMSRNDGIIHLDIPTDQKYILHLYNLLGEKIFVASGNKYILELQLNENLKNCKPGVFHLNLLNEKQESLNAKLSIY